MIRDTRSGSVWARNEKLANCREREATGGTDRDDGTENLVSLTSCKLKNSIRDCD